MPRPPAGAPRGHTENGTAPADTAHTCRLGERCAYRDLPEVDAAHRHRRALLCLFLLIAAFSAGLTTAVTLALQAVR